MKIEGNLFMRNLDSKLEVGTTENRSVQEKVRWGGGRRKMNQVEFNDKS